MNPDSSLNRIQPVAPASSRLSVQAKKAGKDAGATRAVPARLVDASEGAMPGGLSGGQGRSTGESGMDLLRRNRPEDGLRGRVIGALRQIRDPEIPVNIYDLGLVYGLAIDDAGRVAIRMTLTAPGCPVARSFPGQVEAAVAAVEGVSEASVELVWEPPWGQDRMSEAARLQLGLY